MKLKKAAALLGAGAVACSVLVLPFYLMKQRQDKALLSIPTEETLSEVGVSETILQDPLANSLYQKKQHILLTRIDAVPDSHLVEAAPEELQQSFAADFAALFADTPLASHERRVHWENGWQIEPCYFEEPVYQYLVYGREESDVVEIGRDSTTGKLIYFAWKERMGQGESLLENSAAVTHTVAENYIRLLGYTPQDFNPIEPTLRMKSLQEDYTWEGKETCWLYSEKYQLYLCADLILFLENGQEACLFSCSVCSLTPEELRKVVEG